LSERSRENSASPISPCLAVEASVFSHANCCSVRSRWITTWCLLGIDPSCLLSSSPTGSVFGSPLLVSTRFLKFPKLGIWKHRIVLYRPSQETASKPYPIALDRIGQARRRTHMAKSRGHPSSSSPPRGAGHSGAFSYSLLPSSPLIDSARRRLSRPLYDLAFNHVRRTRIDLDL
jgi:hypothetical protein